MTVYMPDELWESVVDGRTEVNASRVIQDALRSWVAQKRPPAAFTRERPADAEDAVAKAKERLVHEAREDYQRGYRAGAKAASHIPWSALDRLAEGNWDLRAWRAHMNQLDRDGLGWNAVDFQGQDFQGLGGKTMTDLLDERLGYFDDRVSLTFEAGFCDGLRAVWESVRQ